MPSTVAAIPLHRNAVIFSRCQIGTSARRITAILVSKRIACTPSFSFVSWANTFRTVGVRGGYAALAEILVVVRRGFAAPYHNQCVACACLAHIFQFCRFL